MTSRQRTTAIRKIVEDVCDPYAFYNDKRKGKRRLKFMCASVFFRSPETIPGVICSKLIGAGIEYNSVEWRTGESPSLYGTVEDYEYIEVLVPEISG